MTASALASTFIPGTVPARVYDPRIGHLLRGKWRLDSLLGVGGTARVYAATHRNGLRGALKLLNTDLKHNLEARERFFYEGLVASRIDHPGVVRVLDDDVTEDNTPFFVMELLEGQTLDAVLEREGRLSPERVYQIGMALLDVLGAAHKAGVVHRDIKPQNIFLTSTGVIKLLDFGIARTPPLDDDARCAKTRYGVTMGTPGYMPPEQAAGNWSRVGTRSDIWSVGATLFRLLTGAPVHEASSADKLIRLTLLMPALPVHARLSTAPAWLASVIDESLSFEPEDRFEDAMAMRQALEHASQPSELGAAPTRRRTMVVRTVGPTLRSSGTPLIQVRRARGTARRSPSRLAEAFTIRSTGGKRIASAMALLGGLGIGMAVASAAVARDAGAQAIADTATPLPDQAATRTPPRHAAPAAELPHCAPDAGPPALVKEPATVAASAKTQQSAAPSQVTRPAALRQRAYREPAEVEALFRSRQ
ncbi:MAG: protein kinase [Polyangiaceae bacterium]|nr:protein kinase [Polyangiaceae bacterium]